MSVVLTPAAIPSSTTVSKVTNPLSTSVVATFEDSYHRKMSYNTGFSGTGGIKVARKKRLVLSAQDQTINLWRIIDRNARSAGVQNPARDEASPEGWQKVLEMDLNVQSNIVSCDVSDDGRWIAVSDWYEVKLFRLTFSVSLYFIGAASVGSPPSSSLQEIWVLREQKTLPRFSKTPSLQRPHRPLARLCLASRRIHKSSSFAHQSPPSSPSSIFRRTTTACHDRCVYSIIIG